MSSVARANIVDIEKAGVIHVPAHLRRKCPAGARFMVSVSDDEIIMKQVPNPDPVGRNREDMKRLIAAREAIARAFAKRGIDEAHMRRTIMKRRAERAPSSSQE